MTSISFQTWSSKCCQGDLWRLTGLPTHPTEHFLARITVLFSGVRQKNGESERTDGTPGSWFQAREPSPLPSKKEKKTLRAFFIWQICAANSGFTAEHSQGTSSAIQSLAALPCAWWIALKWRHDEKYQLSRYMQWISMAEQCSPLSLHFFLEEGGTRYILILQTQACDGKLFMWSLKSHPLFEG